MRFGSLSFRKHGKMFQNAFSPANIVQYRDKQEDLARELVKQIMQKPTKWRAAITRFASSIILSIAYGLRITQDDDPSLVLAERVAHYFANGGSPGSTLVDIAPIIRRLPNWVRIFPSLNFARDNQALLREVRRVPFESVKDRMARGDPGISFVRRMLEEKQSSEIDTETGVTEDDIKCAAANMYAAGTDTTLSTLVVFVLAMVLNPSVQEKSRQEPDRVIGRNRLPCLADRGAIPCIDRLVYETAR
jgi:cytochrome P450